ncbi:MAG: hypothetical protein E4H09_04225 [Spirochaetales bacterium]|nr:MAG: hypothetical protein E4H09_04225 [Spirochaetales bacterium]
MIALIQGMTTTQAENPVGLFKDHADIGHVEHAGSAVYDAVSNTYTLSGAGENVWFTKDQFHFAWRRIVGDFIVTTRPVFQGSGGDPHRKVGWMARTSDDTGAAMVALTVHGDGLTAFQYRREAGANIQEIKVPVTAPDTIQMERRGRSYFASVTKMDNAPWTVELPDFDFPEELMVGL